MRGLRGHIALPFCLQNAMSVSWHRPPCLPLPLVIPRSVRTTKTSLHSSLIPAKSFIAVFSTLSSLEHASGSAPEALFDRDVSCILSGGAVLRPKKKPMAPASRKHARTNGRLIGVWGGGIALRLNVLLANSEEMLVEAQSEDVKHAIRKVWRKTTGVFHSSTGSKARPPREDVFLSACEKASNAHCT